MLQITGVKIQTRKKKKKQEMKITPEMTDTRYITIFSAKALIDMIDSFPNHSFDDDANYTTALRYNSQI